MKKIPEAKELVEEDLERVSSKITTIKYFMAFIINFVESLTYDNRIKHRKESIEVKKVIKEMLDDFAGVMRSNNLKLEWNVSPDRFTIFMNKADFESIILNLLSNSLKSVRELDENIPRKVRIRITRDSNYFKNKFSDNGIGIKDDNRQKIFRLFFTTTKGTGLGLPIVQEILEDYSGTIDLKPYSDLGNGATFVVKIPTSELKK